MRLLNVRFTEDYNYGPFIDEFDRFDEFDIEVITKEYDYKYEPKKNIKDIDEIK
ncbi:MAG: hypothetical protein HKO91_02020 [Desulfobacterales bacterium]|nr:hypothetical protein [Desulfobacterales bacterium]